MRHAEGIRREWRNRDADWSRDPDVRSDRDELLCRAGLRKATNESAPAPQPALMAQALRMLEVLAQRQYAKFCKATIDGKEISHANAEAKFDGLATAWRRHNRGRSVTDYYHFAHLQIVGMGHIAIPFLLERVRNGENFWYMALKAITGQSADTADMRGDASAIRTAWVEWGMKHDLLRATGEESARGNTKLHR